MAWIVATLFACSGDETHPCDAGTVTCESSLRVQFPDDRTAFDVRVSDDLGLALDLTCPHEDTGLYVVNGVTVTCGGGVVTLEQFGAFGDEVRVQVEESTERVFTPDWQIGGDFCGNPCTVGSIAL